MSNLPKQDSSLPNKRIRHVFSLRIDLVIIMFFSAAWGLLQWALVTEPRFQAEGLTREFVQLEAAVCAVIAACAFLHLAASGLGWVITTVRMHRLSSAPIASRPPVKRSA